jgi:putative restriction endonuclease
LVRIQAGPIDTATSLCKLHHAAFDKHFLAIRRDLLKETDGPMLKHRLQGLHRQVIVLPSREAQKPNRMALEQRYQRFKDATSESRR